MYFFKGLSDDNFVCITLYNIILVARLRRNEFIVKSVFFL
jgi:hypothetical protein